MQDNHNSQSFHRDIVHSAILKQKMSSLLVYGGSSTVVLEEEPVIRQPFSDESVARLLVNLDVANRSEVANISETIRTMLEYSIRDGENERGVIKNAILVAFRRRNHQKSRADGEGDGEKALFLAILKAIIALERHNDLVLSVLPLIPVYGSWRDLLLLGEDLCLLHEAAGPENPIVDAICRLFAQQLLEDDLGLTADVAAGEVESTEEADESDPKPKRRRLFTPSNACKYVPHETRHDENKKESETPATGSDSRAGRGGGRRGGAGRGRGRGRGGRGTGVAPPTSEEIRKRHKANKRMSLLIARYMFVSKDSSSTLVSDVQLLVRFRKLRVRLNTILMKRGHLVEPLMVEKKAARINFYAANKSSLTKYQKAINKDKIAASRWKIAMQKSLAAVPDIDSIIAAAAQCLEEVKMAEEAETQDEQLLLSLRAKKAISYLNERLKELREKAKALKEASSVSREAMDCDTASAEEAEKESLRQIVIVDTCIANDEAARLALLLSAVLLAIVQENDFLVVDGNILQLTGNEDFTNAVKNDALGHWLIRYMRQFLSSAAIDGKDPCFLRMREALRLALAQGYVAGTEDAQVCDVLCLCMHFAVYDESSDEFQELLAQLQQPATDRRQLRTFRVHRLKGLVASSSVDDVPSELSTQFVPRPADRRLSPLPSDTSELTADVLFLVDFTGSMGSWMDTVKRELISLLDEIQLSSRMRQVRVALVGYRDYQDPGRVVTVDFKVQADAGQIVEELKRQSADGGGDIPEDLLSGLKAATELDWQSKLRFCVLITDAPAHGMYQSQGGDSHPSGYCPDQTPASGYPTFAQCMQRLAVDLEVDTFFCLLTPSRDLMQQTITAVKKPYADNFGDAGFGTVSMLGSAASKFREQLVAQISAAVANSIVTKDLKGLQSCDGQTLSSLCQSLLQPVRQSMQESAVDMATSTITASTAATESGTAAKEEGKKEKKEESASLESDWQRLQRDLRQASLYPVRLALGMPVHISVTATEAVKAQTEACPSLNALSCDALYRAGLTVKMLQEHDYPEQLIDSYQKHLASKVASLS